MKPRWIVRIVVGVALLVLLVLGAMDYFAKTQATRTADAWLALMEDANAEFVPDEHVVGSPDLVAEKVSKTDEKLTYTWPGVLRSYRVEVVCVGKPAKDGKRFVRTVEGPLSN